MTDYSKLNQPIPYTLERWFEIRQELMKEYGPSIAISTICRRKLGFIPRTSYRYCVYLDFYDEQLKFLWVLKWGAGDVRR